MVLMIKRCKLLVYKVLHMFEVVTVYPFTNDWLLVDSVFSSEVIL